MCKNHASISGLGFHSTIVGLNYGERRETGLLSLFALSFEYF